MKKVISLLIVLLFLLTSSCSISDKVQITSNQGKTQSNQPNIENTKPNIVKRPPPADFGRGSLESLPEYDPNSEKKWQGDLRGYNLSSLNLSDKLETLKNSCFDSKTKWPEKLPNGFNPEKIMEINKNPGLAIRSLHNKGITGKGINIAIIDYALLVDHVEYGNRVKMYEEIHCLDKRAQMHAPAVASLAVGKSVGVAPEANLYFIGSTNFNPFEGGSEIDFTYTAKAIERIIEINRTLEQNDKIRVLSISACWYPENKGYKEIKKAVDNAKKEGIFVASVNMFEDYHFYYRGLQKDALSNPDSLSSYSTIPWDKWIPLVKHIDGFDKYYEADYAKNAPNEILMVPIDSRCTASPTGNEDYVFYRFGGWSWVEPYLAGVYALACQVNPSITSEVFWREALNTGDLMKFKDGSKEHSGKIINPVKLIKKLQVK